MHEVPVLGKSLGKFSWRVLYSLSISHIVARTLPTKGVVA